MSAAMTVYQLGLFAAGIGLISAALFCAAARVHVLIKVAVCIVLLLGVLRVWQGTIDLIGYPTVAMPPDGAVVVSFVLDKPDDAIFFWIRTSGHVAPRGYQIAWDDTIAKALNAAKHEAAERGGVMIFHRGARSGHAGRPNGTRMRGAPDPAAVRIEVAPSFPAKT